MPIVRVNISLPFWQRIIAANPEIPIDPETDEPIMTEVQMARKQIREVIKRYVIKDETRKARQVARSARVPVNEDDFIFED
jgi:hypothetical protein